MSALVCSCEASRHFREQCQGQLPAVMVNKSFCKRQKASLVDDKGNQIDSNEKRT